MHIRTIDQNYLILQSIVEPYSKPQFYIFKLSCPQANTYFGLLIFHHFFPALHFPLYSFFNVDYVSEFAKTGVERLRKSIRMSPERMGYLKGWHHLVVEIELDCSLPGFSVHGISQARRLEWITISSSRESSPSRDQNHSSYVSCFGRLILYHQCHLGRPEIEYQFPKFGGLKIISVN